MTRYDEKDITVSYKDGTEEKFDQFSKVNKKVGISSTSVLAEKLVKGDIINRKEVDHIDIEVGERNILRDQNFVNYVAEVNKDYQFINMFNGESSVLSSCCFVGDEMISVNNTETDKTELISIKDFVGQYGDENLIKKPISKKYTIESLNPETLETEKEIDIVSVLKKPYVGKLYKFTVDGNEIEVTEDHIFLVMNELTNKTEEVRADEFDKEIHLLPINE